MKDSSIIRIRSLSKAFGRILAVDKISLEVKKGETFGILGTNGAGKTTTISILSTLLRPSSGSASVNGYDVIQEPEKVRESIGLVFQETVLDLDLTARDNLDFHARLYHLSKSERRASVEKSLALVGLAEQANRKVKAFSGGMKRRLETARGMLHRPLILFLDEPTLGLDPVSRRNLWEYIRSLKATGTTIILTTHYLEEADSLCDRIAIMDKGKVVALGAPSELKRKIKGGFIRLRVDKVGKLVEALKKVRGVSKVILRGNELILYGKDIDSVIVDAIHAVRKGGSKLVELAMHKPTLDDVFIHFVGEELKDEA